jgi:hypothetical protein
VIKELNVAIYFKNKKNEILKVLNGADRILFTSKGDELSTYQRN